MDVISECALGVANVAWQPRHGSFAFTVVCKATFALRPEISPLAAAQEPVVEADVYTGEGGALALASELVPFKRRPEVLVAGHAYAPGGRPAPSLVARLVAGEIDKAILVVGDRYSGRDGLLGEPEHFTIMPLVWERAAGGPGTSNPAGRPLGSAAQAGASGRVPAPNLVPVGLRLASQSDVVPPVGFGPIAPAWPSRAACLHRHAAWWDPRRWHERPLPDDLDLGYFNVAPPDQQRAQPFGDEVIYLEHMHPRFARLSTRLAPVEPVVMVDHGSGLQRLQARCDTLVIDTDRGLATLVWRAHVLLDRPDRPGRVIVRGPGAPEASPSTRGPSSRASEASPSTRGSSSRASEASPSTRGSSSRASEASPSTPALDTLDVEGTLAPSADLFSPVVLPFSGAADQAPRTGPPRSTAGRAALAAPAVPAEPPTPPGTGGSPPPLAGDPLERTKALGLIAPPAMLPFASTQVQTVPRRDAPPLERTSDLPFEPPPAHGDSAPPSLRPALQGAIAAVAGGPVEADATGGQPSAADAGADDAPGRSAEPAPEVAFGAYPPERCGAIAARLACGATSTADVLRAEELDEGSWQRVHAHWLDRIRDDAARGRKAMLSAYDGAYVSALEAKRGPIALEDYARLAEAAERGAIAGALAERGLPEGAWPHVHRVWIQRLVKDARLGKQVRRAIDALRAAS